MFHLEISETKKINELADIHRESSEDGRTSLTSNWYEHCVQRQRQTVGAAGSKKRLPTREGQVRGILVLERKEPASQREENDPATPDLGLIFPQLF